VKVIKNYLLKMSNIESDDDMRNGLVNAESHAILQFMQWLMQKIDRTKVVTDYKSCEPLMENSQQIDDTFEMKWKNDIEAYDTGITPENQEVEM
jgi:hypothetical protein